MFAFPKSLQDELEAALAARGYGGTDGKQKVSAVVYAVQVMDHHRYVYGVEVPGPRLHALLANPLARQPFNGCEPGRGVGFVYSGCTGE